MKTQCDDQCIYLLNRKDDIKCAHCKVVQRQLLVTFCLACIVLTTAYFLTLFREKGQCQYKDDLLEKLHLLHKRVENLEDLVKKKSEENMKMAKIFKTHTGKDSLVLKEDSAFHDSMMLKIRNKRRANKKHSKAHKMNKVKPRPKRMAAVHVEGTGGEYYPDFPRDNLSGTFHKWKYADWFYNVAPKRPNQKLIREKFFQLDFNNGKLKVKKEGLYLLYAQIALKGSSGKGFYVMKDDKPVSTCYLSIQNKAGNDDEIATCSTVGLFKLDKGDIITIKHISSSGVSAIFNETSSFFGLIRMGTFKANGVVMNP